MTSLVVVTDVTVSIPVQGVSDAARWYKRLFGEVHQIEPATDIIELEITKGVWLQLTQEENPQEESNKHVLRLGVTDIEKTVTNLKALGIQVGTINRIEHLIAWCNFQDPYGNRLSLYQYLS